MELKDVILSTLAEMEDSPVNETVVEQVVEKKPAIVKESVKEKVDSTKNVSSNTVDGEMIYLNSIRERLLVLFEGFQAPNNKNIEAKVDMTLNFLEYVLATIDARVEVLKKGSKQ